MPEPKLDVVTTPPASWHPDEEYFSQFLRPAAHLSGKSNQISREFVGMCLVTVDYWPTGIVFPEHTPLDTHPYNFLDLSFVSRVADMSYGHGHDGKEAHRTYHYFTEDTQSYYYYPDASNTVRSGEMPVELHDHVKEVIRTMLVLECVPCFRNV